MLITVSVLLYIGSFFHLVVGGVTFITVPAELKGKPCSGSAKEAPKDAPCLGTHHFACPEHQQDRVDARERQRRQSKP